MARGTAAQPLLCDSGYREDNTSAALEVTMVGQSGRSPADDLLADRSPRPNFMGLGFA
jgi:hypothetical protein